MDDLSRDFHLKNQIIIPEEYNNSAKPINARDRLEILLRQVDNNDLSILMQSEFKTMLVDHQRLANMLEQRVDQLENENDELKMIIADSQRRYEKAVREMQFFKKKYDTIKLQQQPFECPATPTASVSNHTSSNRQQHLQNFVSITPSSSPQPSSSTNESASIYGKSAPSQNYWPSSPTTVSSFATEVTSPIATTRRRQNSNTSASIFSSYSSGTEATSIYSSHRYDDNSKKLATIHQQPQNYQFARNPSMASSYSSPSAAPSISGASSVMSGPTSSSRPSGHSIILQRKTDPLTFGGSDALWDTISKSQGSDVTVEKIISNFLRRGGSPNTARQSPSSHTVKYGYGMIHALIVTKAPEALDLLLQQGANPNVVSIGQVDDDKVSPCYLAASIGWLHGLEKIVQYGGDLMSARGGGAKKKTALHIAAQNGHAAVVEYIVNMTQGVLNLETDVTGANTLHYACMSGHTDLVSFIIRVCQVPVDESDRRGELPLHWAVRHGRTEVVSLLIERFGCDVNSYISKKVSTPYDMAKSAGHKKLAEYIKSVGGITSKKMDKKREEELANNVPKHLESVLAKNGFFMDGFP